MKKLTSQAFAFGILLGLCGAASASAMELDWSGQFRSEFNWLRDYTMDTSDAGSAYDPVRATAGGYYIAPAGSNNASFETLFLKLKPKLVVNDNIYIKSEFWLGDPMYGFFGNGAPYSPDQKLYNSTFSRGSVITAQRFWGEFLTDFGTLQVGRLPLHYGLGIVWNSGDGTWDRYESTGDAVRLISKFGAFTFSPAAITYSIGNTVGGACAWNPAYPFCVPQSGSGGLSDYSLLFKYENPDEDFDAGLNFIRRIGGAAQDPLSGYVGLNAANTASQPIGFSYNTWDIFAKKRLAGKLTLAGEVPIVTGTLGGLNYSTVAFAGEADYKISDTWELKAVGGHAPGQPNLPNGTLPTDYKAFYFHPNYHLGMIMFNYQLRNLGRLNTQNNPASSASQLSAPFDNPIVDANYAGVTGLLHTDKWTFDAGFVTASAPETCAAGQLCYNNWDGRYLANPTTPTTPIPAVEDQGSSLGWETDLGAQFQYDEYFQFRLDLGLYLPGNFYKFSNVAGADNQTNAVWGAVARVGVNF